MLKLSQISLRWKLSSITALVLLGFIILGISANWALKAIDKNTSSLTETVIPKARTVGEIQEHMKDLQRFLVELTLPGNPDDFVEATYNQTKTDLTQFDSYIEALSSGSKSAEEEVMIQAFQKTWMEYKSIVTSSLDIVITGSASDKEQFATIYREKISPLRLKMQEPLDELAKRYKVSTIEGGQFVKDTTRKIQIFLGAFTGICSLLLVLVSLYSIKQFSRTINSIESQVGNNTSNVISSAREVSKISESISESTTETSNYLSESMETIRIISEKFQLTRTAAIESVSLSQEARKVTLLGNQAVEELGHSMTRIESTNSKLLSDISSWAKDVEEIRTIFADIEGKTSQINDIVFQTKLLSFNASVEAARSGEHGKGFAVVAEEIGKLSRMTGDLATSINQLLQSSGKRVDTVIGNIGGLTEKARKETLTVVNEGLEKAKAGSAQLNSIMTHTQRMDVNASQISELISQQSDSFEMISGVMGRLKDMSENSFSRASEGKTVADDLIQAAGGMGKAVTHLHWFLHGRKENEKSLIDTSATEEENDKMVA